MFKAITDFTGYPGSDLITSSQTISDAMTPIMAQFPKCPLTMAEFDTLIDNCNTALKKKASKAIADTAAFNVARASLEEGLAGIGGCVNTVALRLRRRPIWCCARATARARRWRVFARYAAKA
jgi:hypothetical protein